MKYISGLFVFVFFLPIDIHSLTHTVINSQGQPVDVNIQPSRIGGLSLRPRDDPSVFYRSDYSMDSITRNSYLHLDQENRKKILYGRLRYFSAYHLRDLTTGQSIVSIEDKAKNEIDFELDMIQLKRLHATRKAKAIIWGAVGGAISFTVLQFSFGHTTNCSSHSGCETNSYFIPEVAQIGAAGLFITGIITFYKLFNLNSQEKELLSRLQKSLTSQGSANQHSEFIIQVGKEKQDFRIPMSLSFSF